MLRVNHFILLSFLGLALLTGCNQSPAKRTYHEIVQSAPQRAAPAMMPSSGEARQGRPMSGELDVSAIPDDDVHAFLRKDPAAADISAMPDDDIHAAARKEMAPASGTMPDDEIHAAVRKEQKGAASGAMPMTGAMDPQTLKMLESSVARPPLSWATPQGWQETPGSGMRLVNFTSTDKDDPIECNIISLGGQAGGLESNAARWMQQVNIPVPEAPAMEKFLAAQNKIKTQDGFDATILDLTQLQSKDDLQSPSMVATIITLPDMTMFVKMTGSRAGVLKNKEKFESLCQSLKLNP